MKFLSNPSRIKKQSGSLLPLALLGLVFSSSLALATLEKINDSKRQTLLFFAYSQAGLIADSMLNLSEYHYSQSLLKQDNSWKDGLVMCKGSNLDSKQISLSSPACLIKIQCGALHQDIVTINCNKLTSKSITINK